MADYAVADCLPLPAAVFAGSLLAAGDGLSPELLRKALDAAFRVDQLLPTREERMAVGADFQVQLLLGGPGLPGRTAGAPRLYLVVIRMNAFLHGLAPFKETLIITAFGAPREGRSTARSCK